MSVQNARNCGKKSEITKREKWKWKKKNESESQSQTPYKWASLTSLIYFRNSYFGRRLPGPNHFTPLRDLLRSLFFIFILLLRVKYQLMCCIALWLFFSCCVDSLKKKKTLRKGSMSILCIEKLALTNTHTTQTQTQTDTQALCNRRVTVQPQLLLLLRFCWPPNGRFLLRNGWMIFGLNFLQRCRVLQIGWQNIIEAHVNIQDALTNRLKIVPSYLIVWERQSTTTTLIFAWQLLSGWFKIQFACLVARNFSLSPIDICSESEHSMQWTVLFFIFSVFFFAFLFTFVHNFNPINKRMLALLNYTMIFNASLNVMSEAKKEWYS